MDIYIYIYIFRLRVNPNPNHLGAKGTFNPLRPTLCAHPIGNGELGHARSYGDVHRGGGVDRGGGVPQEYVNMYSTHRP